MLIACYTAEELSLLMLMLLLAVVCWQRHYECKNVDIKCMTMLMDIYLLLIAKFSDAAAAG